MNLSRRLRGLRARLTLGFFVVALGAVGLVSVSVAPGLEDRLEQARLDGLADTARQYTPAIRRAVETSRPAKQIDSLVKRTADTTGVRVTVLYATSTNGQPGVTAASDSAAEVDLGPSFPVAVEAIRSGQPRTGVEPASTGRLGEAARPLLSRDAETGRAEVGSVVVFSTPLRDVEDSVQVVQRRLLVAGAIAVLLAALAGFLVARALSRRVRRLQRGAREVASGDFTGARFSDGRDDELGQLADDLDAMRRQLAELDHARKRFIATASHELRTPVFSLGGFLELLADEELDEETRQEFLAQLRLQVDRLGKLAVDLLDLSRLEAGSLDLRPELTDLSDLARGVADEFLPALAAHDSHLELRVPAERVEAECDPERVAQVMRILVDNALTHTPPGTDVVLTTSRRLARVQIGVVDQGPGIRRAMLPHVFEPFITSDDAQGSGLGLAIAHELAERMAGRLEVDSVPGRTTFTLELPA